MPLGFSQRLQYRLEEGNTPRSRRDFLGWMVAAADAVLVASSFETARSSVFSHPELRSERAQTGAGVPPDMLVVVSTEGLPLICPQSEVALYSGYCLAFDDYPAF